MELKLKAEINQSLSKALSEEIKNIPIPIPNPNEVKAETVQPNIVIQKPREENLIKDATDAYKYVNKDSPERVKQVLADVPFVTPLKKGKKKERI